jgi:hypothetical protein
MVAAPAPVSIATDMLLSRYSTVEREPSGNSAEVSMNAIDNWQSGAQIALERLLRSAFR